MGEHSTSAEALEATAEEIERGHAWIGAAAAGAIIRKHIAALEAQPKEQAQATPLSSFAQAGPEEKQQIFNRVIAKATDEQRAVVAQAASAVPTGIAHWRGRVLAFRFDCHRERQQLSSRLVRPQGLAAQRDCRPHQVTPRDLT